MSKTLKRLIIAAGFSAFGFATTTIWYNLSDTTSSNHGHAKKIARLVRSVNDVQTKSSLKLIWQPAFDNEELHAGEAVRTSPDSEARIEFLDSPTAIDLEADSAVILEENDGQLALDFLKGNILVKANSENSSAAVKSGSITLKSGDKKIALAQGEGQSEAAFGKSKSGDLDIQIIKGTASSADGKTLNSSQIQILKPTLGEPLYLNAQDHEFAIFKWKPLPAGYQVYLEVGRSRNELSPVANSAASEKGELQSALKNGKLFYRLVARPTNPALPELMSSTNRLEVLAKTPPLPLSPEKEATVTVNVADPSVKFLWSNPAGFAKVIIEISSSPNLKPKIETKYLENMAEYSFPFEKSGVYFWRVSGVLEGHQEVVSSSIQKFKLQVLNEIAPPELEFPKALERLSTEAIKEKGVIFSWKPSVGAERYRVVVEKRDARTPASAEKVFEDEGQVLQSSGKNLKPGVYTWSVAAIGPKNESSKFSEKRTFTVESLPELKWADGKNKEDFYYLTLKPSVTLKWEKGAPGATHWTVKVFQDESDVNFVAFEAKTIGADIELPKDGNYQAIVEAFDDKSQVVARSQKRILRIAPAPLLPAPQFAANVPAEIIANGSGSANLEWISVDGAKQYVLLLKTPDSQTPKEYKFLNLQGQVKGLMPGQYKVSLRAVDEHGRTSPESEIRNLKVPNMSDVRAPKLKGLKVK